MTEPEVTAEVATTPVLQPASDTELEQAQRSVPIAGEIAATQARQQVIAAELQKARRASRKRVLLFWSILATTILLNLVCLIWFSGHGGPIPVFGMIAGFLPLLCLIGLIGILRKQAQSIDAEALAKMGGVKAIPILLEILQSPHTLSMHRAIITALATLLPQMRASDAGLLNAGHRRFLNESLRNSPRGDFTSANRDRYVLAILKAYEQVGDAKAIPAVERLANISGKSARRVQFREAAQACLPLLRANLPTVDSTRTLLRAASSASTSPETLLRPATSETVTNPDELLRAPAQPPA
jgi:hypothetical protein